MFLNFGFYLILLLVKNILKERKISIPFVPYIFTYTNGQFKAGSVKGCNLKYLLFVIVNFGFLLICIFKWCAFFQWVSSLFFSAKSTRVDATQEMLALGASNLFGSFFQSMPVTASFGRTAVSAASGVKTTLNGLVRSIKKRSIYPWTTWSQKGLT